ncbi:anticodon-binding protein [Zychaea mexicana]|uniref:anticodon-binding protein n=1 Tax=Zychaea mexicana TaxID=64656 RepID=UPI0022FE354B|nr:anticodon-binding protein [Zychaea mexicana]KAI9484459.1 anticodon-binding protein [Zychaea mexicana]
MSRCSRHCLAGSIAPYRVCIVPTSNNNQDLLNLAETIYDSLEDTAFKVKGRGSSVFYNDVVIDDRKQMFGAKMADAELIGYPFIVVLGKNALQTRTVEVNQRLQGKANVKSKIPVEELGRWLFERQVI